MKLRLFLNSCNSNQSGAFIVFVAITLAMLIGFIALVVDGARLMISSTKNLQLAEHAASVAVREYVTYSPPSSNAADLHSKRLVRVKKVVAAMLNDELNSLFGNVGAQNIITDEEGNIVEGILLTAGQYFPTADSISDTTLKSQCSTNSKLGCWVPFSPGNTQGVGVNSFRAIVTTPSSGLIKTIFLQAVGSQKFSLTDEAFSFLKPRVFMNLVDMSESITEGNFNSLGRYRSKFMFRFADGSSGDGSDCITPWEGSSSTTQVPPSCRFNPLRDDQIWNAEFYNNKFTVPDGICESTDDPTCLNVDRSMCFPPLNTALDSSWSIDRYDKPMWDWEAPSWLIPGCSPIFWVKEGGKITSSDHANVGVQCHSRNSCLHQGGFATYAYRFLGDERSYRNQLFYEPLMQDLVPNNTLNPDPNTLVARQPHFLRFKGDYFSSDFINLKRAVIDPTTGQITEGTDSISGQYLVENPYFLSHDNYNDREDGARLAGWNGTNSGTDPTGPLGYFQLDASFNFVGDMNGLSYNEYWGRGKGFLLPRLQPYYDGPEPYNSILKGIFFMHKLMAEQRVPGDRFATFFFDSSLMAAKAQVPLTPPIIDLSVDIPEGHPQRKLFELLDAINPNDESDSIDRFNVNGTIVDDIKRRLELGIFPDPLAPDTNISHAIAQALFYLNKNGVDGSDIYLNLFTDFIATANCDLYANDASGYEAKLNQCRVVKAGNDTNYHKQASCGGAYGDSQYNLTCKIMGMLNDLIGWPDNLEENFKNDTNTINRKEGLIKYMSKKGITPIFFAFNGTLGGELLYPAPDIGSGCIDREAVKTAVDSTGKPLALVATRHVYGDSLANKMRNQIKQYFREGSNGNFYLYTLGDVSNPVIESGGRVVQLLKPCPNITKDEFQHVFPIPQPPAGLLVGGGSWPMTAKQRIDALCNQPPYSGFRDPPRPVNIWSNSENSHGSFGSYFWSFPEPRWASEFRIWSAWRVANGWDYVIEMNTQNGGSLLNPIYDFGTLPEWRMDDCGDARIGNNSDRCCTRDDNCRQTGIKNDNDLTNTYGSDTWPEPDFCANKPTQCLYNGFGIPAIGKRYTFHMPTDFFTEPFPISLSSSGGLRCDPRPSDPPVNVNGLRAPYGIEGQIREVVEDIVQKPTVLIVSSPFVLTP